MAQMILDPKAIQVAVQNFEDETGGFGDDNENVVRGVVSAYLSAFPRSDILEALIAAREAANVLEGMTGCRGDDDWVWGLQKQLDAAIAKATASPSTQPE